MDEIMGQGTESCGGYEIDYDPYEEQMCDGEWIQSDGSSISVSDMTSSHIRNAARLCRGLSRSSTFSCESEKWDDWVEIFEDELMVRSSTEKSNNYAINKSKSSIPKSAFTEVVKKETRGLKVEKTCRCGNKFKARITDVKRGWGKSCSKSCAARYR